MSNEKDRVYSLTVTLEVRVVATSEQLAFDHVNQVLNEKVLNNPENVGAVEVTDWDVV